MKHTWSSFQHVSCTLLYVLTSTHSLSLPTQLHTLTILPSPYTHTQVGTQEEAYAQSAAAAAQEGAVAATQAVQALVEGLNAQVRKASDLQCETMNNGCFLGGLHMSSHSQKGLHIHTHSQATDLTTFAQQQATAAEEAGAAVRALASSAHTSLQGVCLVLNSWVASCGVSCACVRQQRTQQFARCVLEVVSRRSH